MKIYRKLTTENEREFFDQFEGVVFGVLKRMNISFLHRDYEDYAQIGRMKLARAYETCPNDPWDRETRGKFIGYAFTKIRWGILDAIRKQTRRDEHEQVWDDLFDITLPSPEMSFTIKLLEQEWFQEVLDPLNETEQRLVLDLCVYRLSITDIAKKEGVSRKTIYQRRKGVKNKLLHTLYKEKGE